MKISGNHLNRYKEIALLQRPEKMNWHKE
jgi:hypothetical protein